MSDSEDENFCFYGKALEPYDEDAFPRKKPISVEDQIATDEQGRRRFHGAFTGGFSAGFFNTVGSLEGWKPTEFKSSRSDKADKKLWKPEDYMDDEDISEFGIAPQRVQATSDYSTTKKRKKQVFSDGPIPGEPVLHTLITSGNETIGYLLMKNMGQKYRSEEQNSQNVEEGHKVYGCEMPKTYEIKKNLDTEACQIPAIYMQYLKILKDNSFGLGYSGLDKSHINLFQPTKLVVQDKNNKKLSISGQAFGVGAFEDDDDDIYVKDDMSKYDFELTAEAKKKQKQAKTGTGIFEKFTLLKAPLVPSLIFAPPVIPKSFSGKHNVKKSRFEPIVEEPVARNDMNAAIRAKYLGEPVPTQSLQATPASQTSSKNLPEKIGDSDIKEIVKTESEADDNKTTDNLCSSSGLIFGKFVSSTLEENPHDILETVEHTETLHGTQEMRDAAKMNMFGPLTRIISEWQPCSLLCKRFNVPDPVINPDKRNNIRKKNHIIFEYQKNIDPESKLEPGLKINKTNEPEEPPVLEELKPESMDVVTTEQKTEESVLSNIPSPPVTLTKMDAEERSALDVKSDTGQVTQIVDITQKIDVSKNIDLFKAVFLSSSESESEDEGTKEEETQNRNDLLKKNILTDNLIPKIKSNKEGILSNIKFNPFFKTNMNKSTESTEECANEPKSDTDNGKIDEKKNAEVPNLYGPKLPEKIQPVQTTFTKTKPILIDDDWIEKDDLEKRKVHKHKKKHKKEKRKKEHKSKHRK